MRKRKSVLKPLTIIFVVMFLLNMAVMRICFNINVIGTTALQDVMDSDMARSLLSVVEDESDGKNELIEDTASVSQGTMPASTDPEAVGSDTENSLFVMSPRMVAALQHLSRTDKFVILSILSKMGREEINRIFEISNDGITLDEYEELRVLAENRLKLSDMEALKEILCKNQGLFAQNSGE